MDGREDSFLWCRVEEAGGRVSRVLVMHPSGEILFSYPPEHFESRLLRLIQAGQLRARLSDLEQHDRQLLSFVNESGAAVYSENVPRPSIAEPRDAADR